MSFNFDAAYNGLNAKQKEAVDQIEGPVLVLAGPGTGKTEVLGVRIGNILKQTDMFPSNILCLTFSNAGVEAMKQRLNELIGETAEQIGVYTFHKFCNQIIGIHKNTSETANDRSLLNDGQRQMIVEKLLYENLGPKDPKFLKPTPAFVTSSYINLLKTIKQSGLNKADLIILAEHCIYDILPKDEKYLKKNGELKSTGLHLKNKIEKFAFEIGELYEKYENELRIRKKYEFEDMLNEATVLLNNDSDLLAKFQEQYQYILVDEFQDTNIKQLNLISTLIKGNYEPNLFIVGDDDQCIYKFQGASKESFDRIRTELSKLFTIVLEANYRSTGPLLNDFFSLISDNRDRETQKNKALTAGNKKYFSNEYPGTLIREFTSKDQEAYQVACLIKERIESGLESSEIAVLARTHNQYEGVCKWLTYFKIPCRNSGSRSDLLCTPFGKSLYNIIQFIRLYGKDDKLADVYLSQFLLSKGNHKEIVKAYLKYKSSDATSFMHWLDEHQEIASIEWLSFFLLELKKALSAKDDYLNSETKNTLDTLTGLGNINFIDNEAKTSWDNFCAEFLSSDKQKTTTSLAELLLYYKENKLPIRIEHKTDFEVQKSSVLLSTIHGSKGLQFTELFLIGCESSNWETKSRFGGVKVPEILNRFLVPDGDGIEDQRRLIYVACSRAKTGLNISYCLQDKNEKTSTKSSLLDPILKKDESNLIKVAPIELPKVETVKYRLSADEELMLMIKKRVNEFELSPSSSSSWEICQNAFFYNNIIKITEPGTETLSFGNIIHNILQAIGADPSIQCNEQVFDELMDSKFENFKHHFHPTHFSRYKKYGKWLIKKYLRDYPISKATIVEQTFRTTLANGVKLKGIIDRVENNLGNIKVIDYKTGRSIKVFKEFQDQENPGTAYWRQAMIYSKLMIDNYPEAESFKFQFHYPELDDLKGVVEFDYKESDGFVKWLGDFWNDVQSLSLNSKCDNDECIYCKIKLE